MMREWLGALQPLSEADTAALAESTGCSVAELLAPAQPGWDVLARLALKMLGVPPLDADHTLPRLAHEMATGDVPAAVWAAQMRAVIAADAAQPVPPLPGDADDE